MQQKAPISNRVSDFIFTTLWLTFLNYFEVFANYPVYTRFYKSILTAAAAGLILALIRPTINRWLKPIIKRNKNAVSGRFIIFAVFFGAFGFIDLFHYKADANWSVWRIFSGAIMIGVISTLFFGLLLWAIKKIRGNKNNLQNLN